MAHRPCAPRNRLMPTADGIYMFAVTCGFLVALQLTPAPPPRESATDAAPMLRYINTRELRISLPDDDGESAWRLWTSRDSGRTWQSDNTAPIHGTTTITMPNDGLIQLWIGRDGQSPNVETVPTARLWIDTAAPTIQIHSLEFADSADTTPRLVGRATLIEENITSRGVRLFFRDRATAIWTDAGTITLTNGSFECALPKDAPRVVDVRLVATDLAGNQTISERSTIVRKPRRLTPSANEPQPQFGTKPEITTSQPSTEQIATTRPSPIDEQNAEKLRQLAREFAAGGRFDLAAARFADVSRLRTNDPDVMSEWGQMLLKSGALDDAQQRFDEALQLQPEQFSALLGRGEIADRRGCYREALQFLRRAVERTPDSADAWLRLGDAANRFGDQTEAINAWKTAVERSSAESATHKFAERRLELIRDVGD